MISFTIPGEPVPLLRARVVRNRNGHGVHSFTPDKCVMHAERIRVAAVLAVQKIANFKRLAGPIVLKIDFYRTRPKSAGRKVSHPTTRPDLSNYAKLIEDSLNGLIWNDDSQVVICVSRKLFAAENEAARTEIEIEEMVAALPKPANQEPLFLRSS